MLRKKYITPISLLLMAIFVAGTIGWFYLIKNTETSSDFAYSIHYQVCVHEASRSINQTVFLPIPLQKDGTPTKLLNEVQIVDGNVTFSIVDTLYGLALKINFTTAFKIMAHKDFQNFRDERYLIYTMSMPTEYHEKNYILYSSSTNDSTIMLDFLSYEIFKVRPGQGYSSRSYHHYEWGIENHTLSFGWQSTTLLRCWKIEG